MSVHAYAWAWQQPTASPNQKLVLMAMCEFADSTGLCWPSMATLARMTGLHRSTVFRALDDLIAEGAVMRATGKGKSNTYRLMLTAPRLPSERLSALEAAPKESLSAPPLLTSGGAECDTQVSHSATPPPRKVSHSATGGVAPGATGGVAPDATRTVMNRYEPSTRVSEAVDNNDSWRRIPDASRELASRRIAELRAQLEHRAGMFEPESAADECAPSGMPRPLIAQEAAR